MSDVTARMAPDMAKLVNGLLKPYSGKEREKAEKAVERVRKSGLSGTWDTWVERYTDAVKGAVTK